MPRRRSIATRTEGMVIEFLTFNIEPSERAEWLPVEEATWSRYLEKRPGFIRKEMWTNRENPLEVHAVIWWTDWETWQTVPEEDIVEVDAAMGTWFRDPTSMRVFDVVRDC